MIHLIHVVVAARVASEQLFCQMAFLMHAYTDHDYLFIWSVTEVSSWSVSNHFFVVRWFKIIVVGVKKGEESKT